MRRAVPRDPALGRLVDVRGEARRWFGCYTGHVVVPPGANRDEYVAACARTWTVDVLLDTGALCTRCLLSSAVASNHDGVKALPRFPPESPLGRGEREDLGATVIVIFIEGRLNQGVVVGCLYTPDAHYQIVDEHHQSYRHETEAGLVECGSDGRGNLILKALGKTGGTEDGQGSLTIDVEGESAGEGTIRIRSTGAVTWEAPSGVTWRLGSASAAEPLVLGLVLQSALSQLFSLLAVHNHTSPAGPTGPPLNASSIQSIKSSPVDDGAMLSDWAFTEETPGG